MMIRPFRQLGYVPMQLNPIFQLHGNVQVDLWTGERWPGYLHGSPCAVFQYYGAGHFLLQIECGDEETVRCLLNEDVLLGLYHTGQYNIWLAQFRCGPVTMECPFHAGLNITERFPATGFETYLAIPFVIIEPNSGQIYSFRYMKVGPAASRLFRQIVDTQLGSPPPSIEEFDRTVAFARAQGDLWKHCIHTEQAMRIDLFEDW